ncbi:MAG: hypothetical protein ABIP19_04065 [Dermatophilaceae bacterium]
MKRRSPGPAKTTGPRGVRVAPVLAAAALVAAALAVSGCQAFSPIQTDVAYQPADGVAVDLGDVQIRDLLVVTAGKGEIGTLSGLVLNKGNAPVTVSFAAGPGVDGVAQALVPAGGQTRLSGVEGATPVTLPSIPAAPGDVIKVAVSTPAAGAPVVSVPVLPPTGYYATITAPPVPIVTPGPVQAVPTTPAPSSTP